MALPQAAEGLVFGSNERDGQVHQEWHWPCGCAFHLTSYTTDEGPHVHPCPAHAEAS